MLLNFQVISFLVVQYSFGKRVEAMCKKRQGRGYVSRKNIGNDARIMKFKETIIVCNPCSYVGYIPVVALVLFLDTLVATMGRKFLSATWKHFFPAKEGHGHFRVCRHCWEGKEDQLPDTIDDETAKKLPGVIQYKDGSPTSLGKHLRKGKSQMPKHD